MTGHRALEKKQITQGNSRKVQNPSGSLKEGKHWMEIWCFLFFVCLIFLYSLILDYFCYLNARRLFSCYIECYG